MVTRIKCKRKIEKKFAFACDSVCDREREKDRRRASVCMCKEIECAYLV